MEIVLRMFMDEFIFSLYDRIIFKFGKNMWLKIYHFNHLCCVKYIHIVVQWLLQIFILKVISVSIKLLLSHFPLPKAIGNDHLIFFFSYGVVYIRWLT